MKHVGEYLSVEGEAPSIPFTEWGYLFLATPAGLAILEANHRTQRGLGADIALLDPAALKARFPWLKTDDLAAGTLGLSNEGWIDPYSLLQAFRRKARALGAVYLTDEAVSLERQGSRIEALTFAQGGRIACGNLVDSAGYHAHEVAAMAGIELPIRPRKRFVFVFDCKEPVERAPLLIDPSGVYFRPEGANFIGGVSPPEDQDPDCFDFEIDYRLFEEVVWPTLAERVPAFEAIKLVRGLGGALRLQHPRPERDPGSPSRDPEFLFRQRLQRPWAAAIAGGGTRHRRAHRPWRLSQHRPHPLRL